MAFQAESLDLDAEVLHSYHAQVFDWVCELTAGFPVRRILDLGTGTGTGALALAERFGHAQVIAVDSAAQLLDRCAAKARERGLAARIRLVQADLNAEWPVEGPVDLAWASKSLHHLTAPADVLARLSRTIRPGGFLAVAEIESFPRFLPDEAAGGGAELEERCHAALAGQIARDLPHLRADWSSLLKQAGFGVEATRTFTIDLEPPLPASAGRYAQASLQRVRQALDGKLSADDLAALDALVEDGPGSVLRRDDLHVRAATNAWVARRP